MIRIRLEARGAPLPRQGMPREDRHMPSPACRLLRFLLPILLTASVQPAAATEAEGRWEYPFPVEHHRFDDQRQTLHMAYMDRVPDGADPQAAPTVLLLHGKNFCSAYWGETADFLVGRGYRVVMPDQVGFCRSSLPERYQYSFHQLAANTAALLDALDIDRVHVLGHSMGGMLAARFALMYPARTEQLVMVNPIGLEDWLAEGVPLVSIDALHAAEQRKNYDSIRAYQKSAYYDGDWNEKYAHWARMLADTYTGPDGDRVAWNHALTAQMVQTQPVLYEFHRLKVPTTLIVGLRDRTAIGRDRVDDKLADRLGDYPRLAVRARNAIPDATLIAFDDIGHMPQFEDTQRFLAALKRCFPAE